MHQIYYMADVVFRNDKSNLLLFIESSIASEEVSME